MRQISGNKLLVKALKEEGVDPFFGYPGACTIDISDELYKQDEIRVILPRHEQALVHEADAYARTTGKVGVCLVTSGPGATNLVTGLATANYDSVPLVCFTGQVARHLIGNDAFQEVDIVGITRSITKYGVTVRDRADLGRIIKEAFYIARTGKPGPVLIDLPKDVMAELGSAEYPKEVNIRGYKPNTNVHIGQLKRALTMLHKAKRPLFLAGGGVNIARANAVFTEVVEKTNVPVVTTEPCGSEKWLGKIEGWKKEYPLDMKKHGAMGPKDTIDAINRQFEEGIIVTDVGQHQMFAAQYTEITEKKKIIMSGGLGTMGYGFPGAIGAKLGNPDTPVIAISGDGGMQMNIQEFATAVLEELPLVLCVLNNTYLGMVRQWQKLFYGKRYGMTNLRSGALFRRTNGEEMPEYTPDFVKLAESYGAKGIRVTKPEEIEPAFEEAKKNTKVPTLIEFIIDPEEMVYPMIKPGGTLEEMILDC